ncbi:unnamed protein product, partial [marine sediment metagenome]
SGILSHAQGAGATVAGRDLETVGEAFKDERLSGLQDIRRIRSQRRKYTQESGAGRLDGKIR